MRKIRHCRDIERYENQVGGGGIYNVVGIICPPTPPALVCVGLNELPKSGGRVGSYGPELLHLVKGVPG